MSDSSVKALQGLLRNIQLISVAPHYVQIRHTQCACGNERRSCAQRAGQAAKMNRDNLPPEGVSLTECTPDAAGFIAGGWTRTGRHGGRGVVSGATF